MNKEEEDKLINAIIALHQEIKKQGENTQKELAKVNLGLNELRLSYMKLDESFNKLDESFNKLDGSFNKLDGSFNKYARRNDDRVDKHETRIVQLEEKTSGSSFVEEPKAEYKKRRFQPRLQRKKGK